MQSKADLFFLLKKPRNKTLTQHLFPIAPNLKLIKFNFKPSKLISEHHYWRQKNKNLNHSVFTKYTQKLDFGQTYPSPDCRPMELKFRSLNYHWAEHV